MAPSIVLSTSHASVVIVLQDIGVKERRRSRTRRLRTSYVRIRINGHPFFGARQIRKQDNVQSKTKRTCIVACSVGAPTESAEEFPRSPRSCISADALFSSRMNRKWLFHYNHPPLFQYDDLYGVTSDHREGPCQRHQQYA